MYKGKRLNKTTTSPGKTTKTQTSRSSRFTDKTISSQRIRNFFKKSKTVSELSHIKQAAIKKHWCVALN
jgi:hypothetical protein